MGILIESIMLNELNDMERISVITERVKMQKIGIKIVGPNVARAPVVACGCFTIVAI